MQDSIPVEDVPNYNKLVTLKRKTKETFCKKCKGNLEGEQDKRVIYNKLQPEGVACYIVP